MKTRIKFVSIIFICLTICLGCSKDSDISCGIITDFSFSFISLINGNNVYRLTVELPDGSIAYDTVEADGFISDTYKVGNNYCGVLRK
ncbi:hypothetical protein [Seonamhaeicola maritimus]|uniref:hypothetical protein n=1 Tax=Seonamhaeicola maritimus TaxID=2591822 RepID=UPI0024949D01|nr:hypothetical protein [Seonamhaeicola maritimus]